MVEPVDYQAVLADLKARRVRLDRMIADVAAEMLGQEDVAITPDTGDLSVAGTPPVHPDTFFGLSIVEAIKKFLGMARRAQHHSAIAEALEQGGLKRPSDHVMSGILARAAKGREVVKVGKGMWGLSAWYPKPRNESPVERRKRPGRPRKSSQSKERAEKKKGAPKKVETKAATTPRAAQNGAAAEKNGARPTDIALEIMRAAGKPLHAVEITKRINERGVVASRLPIEAFLSRQTKAGKVQKVGPSTFALAS